MKYSLTDVQAGSSSSSSSCCTGAGTGGRGGAGGGGTAAAMPAPIAAPVPNERTGVIEEAGALVDAALLRASSSSACFLARACRSVQVNFFPAGSRTILLLNQLEGSLYKPRTCRTEPWLGRFRRSLRFPRGKGIN